MDCIELTSLSSRQKNKDNRDEGHVPLYNSCWTISNNALSFSDRIHTVSRLQNVCHDNGWDYSGIFYTNRLRASQSINLRALGFYGPSEKDPGHYTIDLEIQEEFSYSITCPRKLISIKNEYITAEKGKVFFFNFPTCPRVLLQANKWYCIRFQLNGPPTGQGLTHLSSAQADNVTFDFHYGSNQMPIINFTHT